MNRWSVLETVGLPDLSSIDIPQPADDCKFKGITKRCCNNSNGIIWQQALAADPGFGYETWRQARRHVEASELHL